LIIFSSAWPKLPISLQASSGLAIARRLDQLAALLCVFAQRKEPLHAGVRPTARRGRRLGCTAERSP
jgi:hypothetical protein